MQNSSSVRLCLVASTALCQMVLWQPAMAQDGQSAQDEATAQNVTTEDLDSIVVTAQRRSEKAQNIPIALSAFGAAQLERTGVVSIENIAPRVPSFYFGSFGALRPQLYIRGIGTRSFDPGSESSVGVFVDEVYQGRSSGSFGALKDIERIEVLRGPQGTLYGRNTIGGAINVITKAPTAELQGQFEAGVSNYSGWEVFGAVSGPVTADKTVLARLSAWHNQRDGYVRNLRTGTRFQGIDNSGVRLRLAVDPGAGLKIDLTGEYLHDGNRAAFGGFSQGTGPSAAGAPANPRAVFFAAGSKVGNAILPAADLRSGTLSSDPTLDRDAYSLIGKIEKDLGFATLTSVSAFKQLDVADSRDLEGSSLAVIDQSSIEHSKQFTQELRLTSNPGGPLGHNVDWIIGAFYYHDTSKRIDRFDIGVDSVVRAAAGTPAVDTAGSYYKIKSYAFFGQATAHFGDHFEVTVGARYTHDEKQATQSGTTTDALPIIAAAFTTTNKASYSSFDPRIVATWKFNQDVSIYASYSTGFKSGGFQYVPFNLGAANTLFDPEDIRTFEAGLKSEWFDRKLRFNLAAFHYDYKNLQVSRIIDTVSGPQTLISNAASSKIDGVDLEILFRPVPAVDLSIAYGYLDAKYDNYVFNQGQNLVFDDTVLVRAPKHTLNLGAEGRIPVGDDARLTLRADYAVLDTFYHEPGQGDNRFGSGIPLTTEPSYGLLDLRASLELGSLRLTAYATNVTNKNYRRTVNALGSTVVGFAGQPRIVGAKASYSF